jgi:hypothetical protein
MEKVMTVWMMLDKKKKNAGLDTWKPQGEQGEVVFHMIWSVILVYLHNQSEVLALTENNYVLIYDEKMRWWKGMVLVVVGEEEVRLPKHWNM